MRDYFQNNMEYKITIHIKPRGIIKDCNIIEVRDNYIVVTTEHEGKTYEMLVPYDSIKTTSVEVE